MQRDFFPVGVQKSLTIPGFAVGIIDRACPGIINDVRSQNSNLGHACFCNFNGIAQLVIASSCRIHTFLHFFNGCTQLVIDLRTTRGEDEEALLPLLPYIAAEDTTAGEIFGDRRIRTNYTKMNCTRLIRMLKPYLVDEDPALRQMAQQWTSYYRNQSGKGWVDEVEALPVPAEMPILHRGPEKVVLLTDTWCEQEAEHFVQLAKQQGRALLLGRPTMGTLDYTNPVTVLYDAFSFTYSISRTMASLEGNGVDERGVQPNVVVPWTAAECIRDLLAEKAQTL